MLYGEDEDGVSEVVEADAVVAGAEPELGRLDTLEPLHVAFAGGEIAGDGVEDAEGRNLVDGAEVGLALVSVQAIFLGMVTGPCRGVRAGFLPCGRGLQR